MSGRKSRHVLSAWSQKLRWPALVIGVDFDVKLYSNCFNCGTNEYFRPCLVIKSWQ